MRLILVITTVFSAPCQSQSSTYQPGKITGVTLHPNAPGESGIARYDVTPKKAQQRLCRALYATPAQNTVEYAAGMDILVLVENNSIRFSKLCTGGNHQSSAVKRFRLKAQLTGRKRSASTLA